jgi:hypothetical protein
MIRDNASTDSRWSRRSVLKAGAAAAAVAAGARLVGPTPDAGAHPIPPGEWGSDLYESTLTGAMGYTWTKAVFQTPHLKESTSAAGDDTVHFMLIQMQNWLNGFELSYGVRPEYLHIITAVYGPANAMTYDDHVWSTYSIGEWFGVTDAATGAPATRNPYYPSRFGLDATRDPSAPNNYYQDTSIQVLQQRGAIFLT